MNEKFTFFWSGPFSQWYHSPFESGGVTFQNAEMYMMYYKAIRFNDKETAEQILVAPTPKEVKALGRKVANFDKSAWDDIAPLIVYEGNKLKFQTHSDIRKLLLDTIGTTLVEASPFDTIWGIGLSEDNPNALQRETWRGTNWLGEILTLVREDLMENYDNSK